MQPFCHFILALAFGMAIIGCKDSVPKDVSSISTEETLRSDAVQPTESSSKAGSVNGSSSINASNTNSTDSSTDIVFKDDVTSNVVVPVNLDELVFADKEGNRVRLDDYLGKKNIILVFTEGFAGGSLCPFCKAQTARLVSNYNKFAALDTEIFVVYPGSTAHLDEFIEAATKTDKKQVDQLPFPVVLDKELKAVSYFNIASNLAHPSTFIIDKQQNVRLAYVGEDMTADRPSVAAMLRIIESSTSKE